MIKNCQLKNSEIIGYIIQDIVMHTSRTPLESILRILKSQCGIKQAKVAKDLGISPQALTDIKAGRRRFTQEMADKLVDAYKAEPWAGWLAEELTGFDLSLTGEFFRIVDPILPQSEKYLQKLTRKLPLLRAPFLGEPMSSPTHDSDVELPEWAAKIIGDLDDAYALELLADDYAGRLRAGDQLLVVQDVWPDKEIMIVQCPKGLRIARNGMHDTTMGDTQGNWIALDSGENLAEAAPAATVAAILMAKL